MALRRRAFTLIEVLISIALLSLVLLALYKSIGMLRDSNRQLFQYLEKASREKIGTETLFLDIAGSDGNMSIIGNEFSRLCLENTINSLYGLSTAKVCWVIGKKEKRLFRSEGNGYILPLRSDDRVAVDTVLEDIDLFRVYRKKSEVLVMLRQKGKKSISFLVQGVPENIKKKPKKTKRSKKPKRSKKSKRPQNSPHTPPRGDSAPSAPPKE